MNIFYFTFLYFMYNISHAEMVESVDTKDLKSFAFGRAGSIPAFGTFYRIPLSTIERKNM